MTITWSFAMVVADNKNNDDKMHVGCLPFQWSCGYAGAMLIASLDMAGPELY